MSLESISRMNSEDNWYEIVFFNMDATSFYSHLKPKPMYQDEEYDDDEKLDASTRDVEVIELPILLDGDERPIDIHEVLQLYQINPDHVRGHLVYIDSIEEHNYFWKNGKVEREVS